jgi:hypothetical protein
MDLEVYLSQPAAKDVVGGVAVRLIDYAERIRWDRLMA